MSGTKTGAAARPLSPHVQVWRWHITMAGSILHRATGVALYGGALILAGWAACLASGPAAFGTCKVILGSIPGKLVLFGLTFSIFYHLANGIRHLVWDAGKGFDPKFADATAAGAIAFAAVISVFVWGIAAWMGAL
ncbi:succinate dehydrogenase, cytochrome b556 subunit [Phenylobacterium montanum]|uniref:Succinate dehydrogenase cytochrome b556 subunit n=1 Tax=Phenylobacterium montanum TaxID=2823693 RepID=A0A975FXU5_9CAUL|nr:succinate dehydrogenase, cytochrome b556 subunit [Caulobacter sp. S6]QUD86828.1 succinate dehydrogenase, cytochrome b556 subunit [Caulobacter sp. S6]